MTNEVSPLPPKCERRVQAVLALFRGEPVAQVSTRYRVYRSDLYKFHRRALTALHQALDDQPRGPKRPHNRLGPARAQQIASLCQRHPTWSSYQVYRRLGSAAPTPRTIQRVRARHGIARVPKRAPPSAPARRVPLRAKRRVEYLLKIRPHLGPERLVWDVQNHEQLAMSTSRP
jgi:hypothetical protein